MDSPVSTKLLGKSPISAKSGTKTMAREGPRGTPEVSPCESFSNTIVECDSMMGRSTAKADSGLGP